MGELRRVDSEHLVKQKVFGSRREPFLSTDNVSDTHQVVVYYIGEVVGREAIILEDNLVVYNFVFKLNLTVNDVFELSVARVRDFHPNYVGLSVGLSLEDFFFRFVHAESVILGLGVLSSSHLNSHVLQSFRGAEAWVRVSVL